MQWIMGLGGEKSVYRSSRQVPLLSVLHKKSVKHDPLVSNTNPVASQRQEDLAAFPDSRGQRSALVLLEFDPSRVQGVKPDKGGGGTRGLSRNVRGSGNLC